MTKISRKKLEKCWQTKLMRFWMCWYSFVGSHPHLAQYFSTPDNQLIDGYLAAVRKRFYQWILDTCNRSYDQTWLDNKEIGLRHTYAKIKPVCCLCAAYWTAIHDCLHLSRTATIKPFVAMKGIMLKRLRRCTKLGLNQLRLELRFRFILCKITILALHIRLGFR